MKNVLNLLYTWHCIHATIILFWALNSNTHCVFCIMKIFLNLIHMTLYTCTANTLEYWIPTPHLASPKHVYQWSYGPIGIATPIWCVIDLKKGNMICSMPLWFDKGQHKMFHATYLFSINLGCPFQHMLFSQAQWSCSIRNNCIIMSCTSLTNNLQVMQILC